MLDNILVCDDVSFILGTSVREHSNRPVAKDTFTGQFAASFHADGAFCK